MSASKRWLIAWIAVFGGMVAYYLGGVLGNADRLDEPVPIAWTTGMIVLSSALILVIGGLLGASSRGRRE